MTEELAIFIHAARLDGVEERLQEYIQGFEESGLLDACQQVYICTVGEKPLLYIPTQEKIRIQNVSKNLEDFEVPTHQALWNYAREHPNSKILYLHTKGVGKSENVCIEDWVQYMSYFCIDKWKEAVETLNTYDTAGVDLLDQPTLHYSGNFWWSRASYIQSLPSPTEFTEIEKYPNVWKSVRHNQEFWVCYGKKKHYCFWQSGINGCHRHVTPYPTHVYKTGKPQEKTICIFFLTSNSRSFMFAPIIDNMSKCKNKHRIKLLILTDKDDDLTKYVDILEGKEIDYKIGIAPIENNYLVKANTAVQFAESQLIPYLMKHDNDILCPPHMYDYLINNLDVLDDSKNLLLTPTLTSGIPTIEQFMNDFCSQQEKEYLHSLFIEHKFGPLWGADFTPLNKHTIEAKSWNPYAFYKEVKNIPHHYKGIHPVRIYDKAIFTLNDIVLSRKHEIFQERKCSLVYDNFSPYFCNSIFLIKRDTYKTILDSKDLYVDAFDEVPLNRYRDNNKLNIVYTENGAAIHVIYNCITHHGIYERMFMAKYNEIG